MVGGLSDGSACVTRRTRSGRLTGRVGTRRLMKAAETSRFARAASALAWSSSCSTRSASSPVTASRRSPTSATSRLRTTGCTSSPSSLVALVATITANHFFGLYGRMWRHAGADEARQLVLSATVVACVLVALYPLGHRARFEVVPVIVIVVGCMFTTAGMGLLRFHSRLFAWQRGSRRVGLRVAVVGSRDAGAAAIREMLRSPGAGLVPVAVFDDDARAHGLSMLGVPVVGSIDDIPASTSRYTLQQVLLTIPNPPPELVERVPAGVRDGRPHHEGASRCEQPGQRNGARRPRPRCERRASRGSRTCSVGHRSPSTSIPSDVR